MLGSLPDGKPWAVDIKRRSVSKVERGLHSACADLKPDQGLSWIREKSAIRSMTSQV
jgi:hypothetical protein